MGLHEIDSIMTEIDLVDRKRSLEELRSADYAQNDECDCIHLDEQVENLIESDEPWKLEDNACGPLNPPDEIEEALRHWVSKLKEAGYYDEDAERAVFDAFEALIEGHYVPDTPDYDAPKPVKVVWIERFNQQIPVRLKALGIELNG